MDYYVYKIKASAQWAEILMAFLGDLPFDTFQEKETGFEAFVPENQDVPEIVERLAGLQSNYPFSYTKEKIESQNWNEVWESNFDTVVVGDFCGIRADFHPSFPNLTHEIIINPKMAFGTGHHATTHMMIAFMEEMEPSGKAVFDYGSGTGILAILAAKMGCTDIDAVDIEKPAYLNMLENNERNGTPGISCFHGTLDNVPHRQYDIILANINRNVILDSFPALYQRLKPGGVLLTSGYLLEDQEMMNQAHLSNGFLPHSSKNRGKWIATLAYRRY